MFRRLVEIYREYVRQAKALAGPPLVSIPCSSYWRLKCTSDAAKLALEKGSLAPLREAAEINKARK